MEDSVQEGGAGGKAPRRRAGRTTRHHTPYARPARHNQDSQQANVAEQDLGGKRTFFGTLFSAATYPVKAAVGLVGKVVSNSIWQGSPSSHEQQTETDAADDDQRQLDVLQATSSANARVEEAPSTAGVDDEVDNVLLVDTSPPVPAESHHVEVSVVRGRPLAAGNHARSRHVMFRDSAAGQSAYPTAGIAVDRAHTPAPSFQAPENLINRFWATQQSNQVSAPSSPYDGVKALLQRGPSSLQINSDFGPGSVSLKTSTARPRSLFGAADQQSLPFGGRAAAPNRQYPVSRFGRDQPQSSRFAPYIGRAGPSRPFSRPVRPLDSAQPIGVNVSSRSLLHRDMANASQPVASAPPPTAPAPAPLSWTPMRSSAGTAKAPLSGSKRQRVLDVGSDKTPLIGSGLDQGRRLRHRPDLSPASAERRVWRAGRTPFHPRKPEGTAASPLLGPGKALDQNATTDTARRILASLDALVATPGPSPSLEDFHTPQTDLESSGQESTPPPSDWLDGSFSKTAQDVGTTLTFETLVPHPTPAASQSKPARPAPAAWLAPSNQQQVQNRREASEAVENAEDRWTHSSKPADTSPPVAQPAKRKPTVEPLSFSFPEPRSQPLPATPSIKGPQTSLFAGAPTPSVAPTASFAAPPTTTSFAAPPTNPLFFPLVATTNAQPSRAEVTLVTNGKQMPSASTTEGWKGGHNGADASGEPVFDFGGRRNNEVDQAVARVCEKAGMAQNGPTPVFEFGTAKREVSADYSHKSEAAVAARKLVAEAAAKPLPVDDSDDEDDGNAAERKPQESNAPKLNGTPAASTAPASGGWDLGFLNKNKAAAIAATEAAKKEIEHVMPPPVAKDTASKGFSFGAPITSSAPTFAFGNPLPTAASAAASFSSDTGLLSFLGSAPASGASLSVPATTSTAAPTTGFTFGGSSAAASTGFSFGAPAISDASAKKVDASSKPQVPAAAEKPPAVSGWGDAFLKGNRAAASKATSAAEEEIAGAGGFKAPGALLGQQGSGLGQGVAAAAAGTTAAPSSAPAFSFGVPSSNAATAAPSFSFSAPSTTAPSTFTFGAAPLSTTPPATNAAAAPTVDAGSGLPNSPSINMDASGDSFSSASGAPAAFTFGGSGAQPSQPFAFGSQNTQSAPAFSTAATASGSVPFGASAPTSTFSFTTSASQPSAAPAFAFGASSAAAQPMSAAPFAFGASSAAPAAPSAGTSTFTFGATSAPATEPAFGFGSTFGGSAPSSAHGGFAFGTGAPAFGSAASSAPAPMFGQSQPAFGGSNSAAPAFGSTAAPTFGATSAAAFGGASGPAFGAPSGPAFGAASTGAFGAAPTASFGGFGSNATQQPFGAAAPAGGFGQSAAAPAGAPFGDMSSSAAFGGTGGFVFGSSGASQPAAPSANGAPAFGAPAFGAGMTMGAGDGTGDGASGQVKARRVLKGRRKPKPG